MMNHYRIGGTVIRIDCDAAFCESAETLPFVTDETDDCVTCVYRAADQLALPEGRALFRSGIVNVYQTESGVVRTYALPMMKELAAVVTDEGGRFLCRYNRRYKDHFFSSVNLLNAVGIESVLFERRIFLFHCAFIELNGQAILFSGASGVGKSTRANMWIEATGARLINGDKAALVKRDGVFYACGLPVAGSSKVFLNEEYPIQKVVFLSQGKENVIRRLTGTSAFAYLFRNTVVNSWNPEFSREAAGFLSELCSRADVYFSQCDLSADSVLIQMKEMGV